jgi:hypothetical protein
MEPFVSLDQIELTLLPAPDDPDRVCHETQAKLLAIQEDLRKRRVSVITVGARPSGDTHLGQFVITLGPGAVSAVAAIARAWITTRFGRGVRLTLDDVEAEVSAVGALDGFLRGRRASRLE